MRGMVTAGPVWAARWAGERTSLRSEAAARISDGDGDEPPMVLPSSGIAAPQNEKAKAALQMEVRGVEAHRLELLLEGLEERGRQDHRPAPSG